MILIACVLLLCFAGVLLLKPSYDRRLRRTALLDRLPGPPPPPSAYFSPIYSLVGHIPQLILPDRSLMESILVVPEELNRQYGQRGIFKLDTGLLGGGSVVVLTKAHTVEPLLRCAINIRKDDTVYGVVHDWWGDGIIASDGDKWHRHRKLLTPAFHFKILQDFLPIINKQSDILIKKLIKSSESGQQEVDMIKVVSFTMLDTIAETSMGIQLNSQTTGRSAYHESIQVIGDTMVKRAFGDLKYRFDFTFHRTELGRYYRRARDYLISFTRTIIEERKKSLIEEVASKGMEEVFGSRRAAPLMNVLLKHHLVDGPEEMKLSVKNVLDETQHFLIGALDTSTYTISWVLYLLAINPDHQRLVHEELDAILGDEDQTAISKDQLSSLTYLEMCIKETLRIYPTLPIIGRKLVTDMTIEGFKIPAGTRCVMYLLFVMRDAAMFPEPLKFDPLRFTAENSAGRHPYAYIPFSAGPRNCIGQKYGMMGTKLMLAKILKNFTVSSDVPFEKMRIDDAMVCRPVGGELNLTLTRRHK